MRVVQVDREAKPRFRWAETFRLRDMPVFAYRWTFSGQYPRHDHDFFEVQVFLGGRGVHVSAAGELAFARGDACVLRPGAWHGYRDCEGMTGFVCCFGAELMHRELGWTLDDPLLASLLWHPPPAPAGVRRLRLDDDRLGRAGQALDALAAMDDDPSPAHRLRRLANLTLVLAELAGGDRPADEPAAADGGGRPAAHPAVMAAVRLIEERMREPWTVDRLAAELRIDASYLHRLFRAAVGLPPMAYLMRARVERATRLLLRTDRLVADVGAQVGLPDPNHFARRFRAQFGVSPTEYRARMSGRAAD